MDLVQDVGFFGRGKEVWNIVAKGGSAVIKAEVSEKLD